MTHISHFFWEEPGRRWIVKREVVTLGPSRSGPGTVPMLLLTGRNTANLTTTGPLRSHGGERGRLSWRPGQPSRGARNRPDPDIAPRQHPHTRPHPPQRLPCVRVFGRFVAPSPSSPPESPGHESVRVGDSFRAGANVANCSHTAGTTRRLGLFEPSG